MQPSYFGFTGLSGLGPPDMGVRTFASPGNDMHLSSPFRRLGSSALPLGHDGFVRDELFGDFSHHWGACCHFDYCSLKGFSNLSILHQRCHNFADGSFQHSSHKHQVVIVHEVLQQHHQCLFCCLHYPGVQFSHDRGKRLLHHLAHFRPDYRAVCRRFRHCSTLGQTPTIRIHTIERLLQQTSNKVAVVQRIQFSSSRTVFVSA